jgi:hypothetical protein
VADGGSGAEAQIDALYRSPLAEFTAARNQLARELRRDGARERAEQVKGLRKPSVAAWTLNQLRRRHPKLVDGLLDAGLRLREAQEQLLAEGERGRLRTASAHERQLVGETVQAAEAVLREAGHAVSAQLHNKLWETTHAAAVDPELGERLRRGRLDEDRQISDLGLIGGVNLAGLTSSASPAPAEATPPPPSPASQRRLTQARRRQEKAEEKLRAAQRNADEAEAERARAQDALHSAEADAARARSVATQADAAVEQARELVQEASARVDTLEAN